MTPVQVKTAIHKFVKKYRRAALYSSTDAIGIQRMLIDKLPASLEARKEHYRTKLLGKHAKGEVKYDIAELIGLFALNLRTTAPSGLSASVASKSAATRPNICHNCGKLGHQSCNCPLKCPQCNLRCCPGRDQGAQCVIKTVAVSSADIQMASSESITLIALIILHEQHAKLHNLPIEPLPCGSPACPALGPPVVG